MVGSFNIFFKKNCFGHHKKLSFPVSVIASILKTIGGWQTAKCLTNALKHNVISNMLKDISDIFKQVDLYANAWTLNYMLLTWYLY